MYIFFRYFFFNIFSTLLLRSPDKYESRRFNPVVCYGNKVNEVLRRLEAMPGSLDSDFEGCDSYVNEDKYSRAGCKGLLRWVQ